MKQISLQAARRVHNSTLHSLAHLVPAHVLLWFSAILRMAAFWLRSRLVPRFHVIASFALVLDLLSAGGGIKTTAQWCCMREHRRISALRWFAIEAGHCEQVNESGILERYGPLRIDSSMVRQDPIPLVSHSAEIHLETQSSSQWAHHQENN